MDSGFSSSVNTVIQALDPGHAILEIVRPALTIFRSETFAPDISLAMIMSALLFALYFRFFRVGPACDTLRIRTNFLKKCTTNKIFSDNFYEFDLLMKEGHFLEPGWNEFVETCLLHDPRLKANVEITVRPSDFININDAEHCGLGIKWFHRLSAMYVGVGLLFTFAGLVAALYFSSAAINAVINSAATPYVAGHEADVQRALAQLLNTATFKFLTSIAGLGCSILLAYLDSRWRARLERNFDDLCRELERCTVMVTPEAIAERQYRMLGDIADLLKKLGSANTAGAEPAPANESPPEAGPPLHSVIGEAMARLETVVANASQSLANRFDQSLARHTPPPAPLLRPEPIPMAAPAPVVAPVVRFDEAALAATLNRTIGEAFAAGTRSMAGALEQTLTQVLLPSLSRALEPAHALPMPLQSPPPAADTGIPEAAARIEAAVATAAADLRALVAEARGLKADVSVRLTDLAAAIHTDGERTAALIQGQFSELASRQTALIRAPSADSPPSLDGSLQSLARLNASIERLAGNFDQVEGRLASHLAAFDGLSRTVHETDQAIATSARALQTASLPLSRVGTDIAGSVTALTSGIDAAVRALLGGQESGQRLADELKTTCGQLQEVWSRHEGRFVAVDDSVARILSAIIQHAEAHGEAVRNHVVAIDNHLGHAVGSLAANIEALQEMTSDLTEAVNGTDRLASLISGKAAGTQG